MQKNLFPSQISDSTTEHFLSQHSNKSQIIYSSIVFAVIVAITLLPVLKVDVSVQANGIIRPVCEKNEIKSIVSRFRFIENLISMLHCGKIQT